MLTNFRDSQRRRRLRRLLKNADPASIIEYPLTVVRPEQVRIGRGARISWFTELRVLAAGTDEDAELKIIIGDDVYLGNHVCIIAAARVTIGKNTLVADRVRILATGAAGDEGSATGDIAIGEDCWIGENVTIRSGVTIGRHCVVGANAVLERDLPDYTVAVGAPARIIKRYDPETHRWEQTSSHGHFRESPAADDPADSQEQTPTSAQTTRTAVKEDA